MPNLLFKKDIISLKDFSKNEIISLLELALQFKTKKMGSYLQGKVIAHCFFEPSTRTRLSFETACLRLGGQNIGFSNAESLSITKGETLADTIKTLDHYADAIVLRHHKEGAARFAAEIANIPVINAGDGANQHPTQALADLLTIMLSQKRLENLSIGIVGDLKYGRTIHSLIQAGILLKHRFYFVCPNPLSLPTTQCEALRQQSIRFSFHNSLQEVIPKIDILYMTRLQHERFSQLEKERLNTSYILYPEMLHHAKPNLKILHPLPRGMEIPREIDCLPQANYFEQVENAMFMRQALLSLILNKELT